MNDRLVALARRIQSELNELNRVVSRIYEGWQRAQRLSDDYYLDSVALNLHGFYSGLERIFEQIAQTIDGEMPQSPNWHQSLLQQMAKEVPGIRPSVISSRIAEKLNDYRGFRHVVRNVYTYQFDPVKLQKLVDESLDIFKEIEQELTAFTQFLVNSSKNMG